MPSTKVSDTFPFHIDDSNNHSSKKMELKFDQKEIEIDKVGQGKLEIRASEHSQ